MKGDSGLLCHIRDEVNFLQDICKGMTIDAITSDPVASRAVLRSLEIIGEAAKQISPELKENYPHIEWKSDCRNEGQAHSSLFWCRLGNCGRRSCA